MDRTASLNCCARSNVVGGSSCGHLDLRSGVSSGVMSGMAMETGMGLDTRGHHARPINAIVRGTVHVLPSVPVRSRGNRCTNPANGTR